MILFGCYVSGMSYACFLALYFEPKWESKMSKKLISTLSVLLLAGMVSTSVQALPTPIQTELSVYTQAHVFGGNFEGRYDPAWTSGTASMGVGTSAFSEFDGASATSQGIGANSFSNSAAGNVSFQSLGWRTEKLLDGRVQVSARFLYEFTMNENGKLNLLWDITSNGLSDPLIGNFSFFVSGMGAQLLQRDTGFNEASFDLLAGTTYMMLIMGDWSAEGALGTQGFTEDANFFWNITPTGTQIPEPNGLLLLGLSLALLFGVQKRS